MYGQTMYTTTKYNVRRAMLQQVLPSEDKMRTRETNGKLFWLYPFLIHQNVFGCSCQQTTVFNSSILPLTSSLEWLSTEKQ